MYFDKVGEFLWALSYLELSADLCSTSRSVVGKTPSWVANFIQNLQVGKKLGNKKLRC